MSMFENAETFLDNSTNLFADLLEGDLVLPERLLFIKGERVEGTILDASIIEQIGAVKFEVMIQTGEHTGKLHELVNFKPRERDGKISPQSKKSWVEFLLAFFTKEEILGGKVDFTKHIGTRIEFISGEARSKGEKTYQNYHGYKIVTAEQAPF